jgi:hypothetical protein
VTASSFFAGYSGATISFAPIGVWSFSGGALHKLSTGRRVQFGGSVPTGITAGVDYYVRAISLTVFYVYTTYEGAVSTGVGFVGLSTSGTCTITTPEDYRPRGVRLQADGQWRLDADTEWGTATQGYWQIPDAQAGLKNAALKPYIDFDLGSAKTLKTFLIRNTEGVSLNNMTRLVQVFSDSASDFSTAKFEGYAEVSQRGGEWTEIRLHGAASRRYWRICDSLKC